MCQVPLLLHQTAAQDHLKTGRRVIVCVCGLCFHDVALRDDGGDV